MATTCTNCGCSKPKCGCQDTMLTSPAPCPTPVGCLTPEPCSEVLDAQCIIYTGDDIICNTDTVVSSDDSVALALNNIVDYFCNEIANIPVVIVEAGDGIVVTPNVVGYTTTYTVASTSSVKFVKEFTSSLDGEKVTILGTEIAGCNMPVEACNTNVITYADFTYSISFLYLGVWTNITNIDTVVLTVNNTTGDVFIELGYPPTISPVTVRVTIIG